MLEGSSGGDRKKKSNVEKGTDDDEENAKEKNEIKRINKIMKKYKIDIDILKDFKVLGKEKRPVEDEDSGWLTWMVSGRKRGSADIKMQELEC